MTFRSNYWSCSKFAAWLRSLQGIPSPYALSMEDWKVYKKEHKHKLCYKLAEWLDNVQDVVYFPADIAYSLKCYVQNRLQGSSYLPTSLEEGKWYDLDTRIKYGLMENFIIHIEKHLYKHILRWNGAYLKEKGIDKDLHAVLKFWQELQDEGRGEKPWKEILDTYYKSVYIMRERVAAWDMEFETSEEYTSLEAQQDKEDEKVMVAIIKFRKFLWT